MRAASRLHVLLTVLVCNLNNKSWCWCAGKSAQWMLGLELIQNSIMRMLNDGQDGHMACVPCVN